MSLRDTVLDYKHSATVLEDVQNHVVISERMMSSDVMLMFLIEYGVYDTFLESENPLCTATMMNIHNGGEFNFMQSHPLGYKNIYSLGLLEAAGIIPTEMKESLVEYCNIPTLPYENVTQEDINPFLLPPTWKKVGKTWNVGKECYVEIVPNGEIQGTVRFRLSASSGNDRYSMAPQSMIEFTHEFTSPTIYRIPFLSIPMKYRSIELEYLEPWDGSILEVKLI